MRRQETLVPAAAPVSRFRLTPRLRGLLALMGCLAALSAVVNSRRLLTPAAPPPLTDPSPGPRASDAAPPEATIDTPMPRDARLARARALFLSGRFVEADAHLSILLAAEPRRAELHYWRALARRQSGLLEAGLAGIERASALEPENAAYGEALGDFYLAAGRSMEAARAYDALLKRRPASYAALIGKARAKEQMYEAKLPVPVPEIVEPVEKAVKLEPDNPRGVTMLARMAFAYLQEFPRAEQLAKRAAELDPRAAAPYLILAEIYLNGRDPASGEKAVDAAREAARRDKRRPEPLYLLGRALLRRDDLSGAIDALERSTQIQLMPQAVYQLSLAHGRAGNPERARHYSRIYDSWSRFAEQRKTLLALYRHRPDDPAIHADLAELYLAHGARDPARNWTRRGLQHCPEDRRLRRLLSRLGE